MIETGKIVDINKNYKEWFLGSFINESQFNTNDTKNFEVKWSTKDKGFKFPLKDKVVEGPTCKSLVILISGKFLYSFLNDDGSFKDYLLSEQGQYIFWTPDINHKVEALEDSITLTIRWYK